MIELLTQKAITASPAQWLEARRSLITGSDVAAILGVKNPNGGEGTYSSPTSVYWNKVEGDAGPDALQMKLGRHFEAFVADWYAETYPAARLEDRGLCVHPERTWQGCTFDRIDTVTGNPVEIKTSVPRDGFGDPPYGSIPGRYLVQALWQADIAAAKQVIIPVMFLPHGPFRVYWVDVDADALEDLDVMRARARSFIDDHLIPRRPPPVDWAAATTRTLRRIYSQLEVGTQVKIPAGLAERAGRMLAAKAAVERREELLKNEFRVRMGSAQLGVRDGLVIARRSESAPSRVDLDEARTKFPLEIAECTHKGDPQVSLTLVKDPYKPKSLVA
jgi:predicted phage-related endonuclease